MNADINRYVSWTNEWPVLTFHLNTYSGTEWCTYPLVSGPGWRGEPPASGQTLWPTAAVQPWRQRACQGSVCHTPKQGGSLHTPEKCLLKEVSTSVNTHMAFFCTLHMSPSNSKCQKCRYVLLLSNYHDSSFKKDFTCLFFVYQMFKHLPNIYSEEKRQVEKFDP